MERHMPEPNLSPSVNFASERWEHVLSTWLPYVALAMATLLAIAQPGHTWAERGSIGAWAALAAVWVCVMYTRAPEPRAAHHTRMIIYFVGLLAVATALMLHQPIFFVFAAIGFLHAGLLRPWPLMILGVAATSILINTIITDFPWPTIERWMFFGSIVVIQTLAFGFGIIINQRMTQLSEERKQAIAKLEAALQENAGLYAQLLVQAREAGVRDERQRMAREIHDTLAQGLTGIITQLEAAMRAPHAPHQWRWHLDQACGLARSSLTEARRSVQALRPEPLETVALPEAIARLARHWADTTGVELQMATTGHPRLLVPEIDAALFRVAQEALANVAKHARATKVAVTLSYTEEVVVLDIRDDGIGFVVEQERTSPSAQAAHGFGLRGMEQRLQRVAGSLTIESRPGEGTAISASVPALDLIETGGVA